MPDIVYCGDCGGEMAATDGFYHCPVCSPLKAYKYVGKVSGRMPSGKPNMQNHPKTLSKFDGGGVQGACHTCGCAFGECECGKDK